jgi:hypothetical protein
MELTVLVTFRLDEHGRASDNESFSRTILGESEAPHNLERAAQRMKGRWFPAVRLGGVGQAVCQDFSAETK